MKIIDRIILGVCIAVALIIVIAICLIDTYTEQCATIILFGIAWLLISFFVLEYTETIEYRETYKELEEKLREKEEKNDTLRN